MDDEALAVVGRWPWPRSTVARLLRAIAQQHPASVGIDAIFAEKEPSSASGRGEPSEGDRELAEVLCSGPFVLGYEFTFAPGGGREMHGPHPLPAVVVREGGGRDPLESLWHPSGVVSSLPAFSDCTAAGFVNAAMEHGGVLRRMPVVMEEGGRLFPSLALATLLKVRGRGAVSLRSEWSGGLTLRLGRETIPLDPRGRLLLRYREQYGRLRPISAAALLEGRVPPETLRGRVVFMGATATGMGEAVATPLNAMLSGVHVHALAADNMARGDFARESSWPWRGLAVVVLGSVATLVAVWLPALRGALLLTIVALLSWLGGGWLLRSQGILLAPVFPVLVLAGNFTLLGVLRAVYLEKGVQSQGRDLAKARDLVMTALASLTEIRDMETGAHVLRCQRYLFILCEELARFPRFSFLDRDTIELVSKLAPLHDIGKVGLPDQLLRKASGFTREEYEVVKQHTVYGRDAIARAAQRVGVHDDELIRYAKEITYSHHERWNGSGYPEGLAGDAIPWVGRVMALVDAYDAMVTQRVYNKPISHEEAVRIMVHGKGVLFDPDVVEAFLAVQEKWRRVVREIRDEAE